mmetsp:Transcript_7426/g.30180  ORF Transcript_7426/g.30180 Transcript_7426/m.30180 type:complete len:226 (+) Transcript_7426:178-855(+)
MPTTVRPAAVSAPPMSGRGGAEKGGGTSTAQLDLSLLRRWLSPHSMCTDQSSSNASSKSAMRLRRTGSDILPGAASLPGACSPSDSPLSGGCQTSSLLSAPRPPGVESVFSSAPAAFAPADSTVAVSPGVMASTGPPPRSSSSTAGAGSSARGATSPVMVARRHDNRRPFSSHSRSASTSISGLHGIWTSVSSGSVKRNMAASSASDASGSERSTREISSGSSRL